MTDEDDSLSGLYVPEGTGTYRDRSATLWADPKMRELKHYARSQERSRELKRASTTGEESGAFGTLRSDGCKRINEQMRRMASEKALLPYIGSRAELPDSLKAEEEKEQEGPVKLVRRTNRFQSRLQWRDEMDHSLRRLFIDVELARDERLKEYSHQVRCEHLDKIYDWYLQHGMQEARKERATPPYVRYTSGDSVMPGSLRPAPRLPEEPASPASPSNRHGHGMGQSASLPALLAGMGLESPVASPKAGSGTPKSGQRFGA